MDVLNGLHIEPDDHESKPISKGIDLRKPATEHDLTSLSQQACQLTSESHILPTTIVRLILFRHNPLLLYPTGGYQQNIGTLADYVSVGDW
jgi:hypothetical protein